MANYKREIYNIALKNQGFILSNTPKSPARSMVQAPVFGNRFASGDRDYNDFTFWWYWAQKDWSAGFKNKKSWEDDAKYYFSTNIDAFDEYGTLKLAKAQELQHTFDENIIYGQEGEINPAITETVKSPASTQAATGAQPWTNPTNAYASDNAYATNDASNEASIWYNFSLGIPSGATIIGIEVLVEAKASTLGTSPKIRAYLSKDSLTAVGDVKLTDVLTTDDVVYTLGDSDDLWGTTWASTDFGANFGVWLSGSAYGGDNPVYSVDHIQVKVYYRPPSVDKTYYIGTDKDTSGKPVIYQWDSVGEEWDNITDAYMSNTRTLISQIHFHRGIMWFLTEGTDGTKSVNSWDGITFKDHTADIRNTEGISQDFVSATCMCSVGVEPNQYLYIALYNPEGKYSAIIRTSEINPEVDDWDKILEIDNKGDAKIIDINGEGGEFGSDLSFLLYRPPFIDYGVWTVGAHYTVSSSYRKTEITESGLGGKLFHSLWALRVITIPPDEIWFYSGGLLGRVLKRENSRQEIVEGNACADFSLIKGGVIAKDRIYWGNLIGNSAVFMKDYSPITYMDFANWVRPLPEELQDKTYLPLFVDSQDKVWGIDNDDRKSLYVESESYKDSTAEYNYLVFSEFDAIATVDKLFYSINTIFRPLEEDQRITFDYSLDGGLTWEDLGEVSYAIDGGVITTKTFLFPENTIAKKVMFKVGLEDTSGTSTPVFEDISTAYYPVPDYKQRWGIRVQCFDNLMLLDGKTKEAKTGEELRNILNGYWRNREIVEFQDVDFAETKLSDDITAVQTTIPVDSLSNFAEKGIIRIGTEKIKYDGKSGTSFLNCVRGYGGTIADEHDEDDVCSNSHKVIITDYSERTPVGAKPKINEFVVELQIMEI